MENKQIIDYYESRMWDVKLADITSDNENAEILRKLRDNDSDLTSVALANFGVVDEYKDFIVSDDDDLGWLGYFIGRNSQLKELFIWEWLEGNSDHSKIDAFAQGIGLNRSITKLRIDTRFGEIFLQHLGRFFRNNKTLINLYLFGFDIGLETARNLAVMLRDMSLESLEVGRLCYDSDSGSFIDEGAVTAEIITALSKHTKLESLRLITCNLDRSGCMALGRLSSLKVLKLFNSNVDDEGVKALVGAIASNNTLEVLDLSQNTSITAKGLSSLSSLLRSEKCCLRELALRDMYIGDDGAAALVGALAGNKSLKRLDFFYEYPTLAMDRTGMTAAGWSTLTRLLCDTSSINNTYLSNHTLERCDTAYDVRMAPPEFRYYLSVNKTQQHVAMHKILKSHADFEMKPLFQWQLKFLPFMIAWFARFVLAREDLMASKVMRRDELKLMRETFDSLPRRELSVIYQFVRGLPMMTVASLRNQSTDTESKKRKLDHL